MWTNNKNYKQSKFQVGKAVIDLHIDFSNRRYTTEWDLSSTSFSHRWLLSDLCICWPLLLLSTSNNTGEFSSIIYLFIFFGNMLSRFNMWLCCIIKSKLGFFTFYIWLSSPIIFLRTKLTDSWTFFTAELKWMMWFVWWVKLTTEKEVFQTFLSEMSV